MKHLNCCYCYCQYFKSFLKSAEPLSTNLDLKHDPKSTHAICGGQEVPSDVVSGQNEKIVHRYIVVNFEVANTDSFGEDYKSHFAAAEAVAAGDNGVVAK